MLISNFVPNTAHSIDKIGFLFGAGTSVEAGYPLTSGLTREVISALNADDRPLLDDILAASNKTYDDTSGLPNIEDIADLVTEHALNSNNQSSLELRHTLRQLVQESILAVFSPDVSNHVIFLEALKQRSFGRATRVNIFTTNYDLCIERAAQVVGVKEINGFEGVLHRYFAEKQFSMRSGSLAGNRFKEDPSLSIALYKLHGSVSWLKTDDGVLERDPEAIRADQDRCMILPRKSKVKETLNTPYDRLFAAASSVLGTSCQFLISSGFSFNDTHINETLVRPQVTSGRVQITNFCEDEPEPLRQFRARPNVTHICRDHHIIGGSKTVAPSDLWKFSEFVKLF